MNVNETPTAGRPRHVTRSVIVSVLALAALLLGLFAVHSVGAEHEMAVDETVASVHAVHSAGANGVMASVNSVIAVASSSDGGWLGHGADFMAGCGILAMTCSVVLIVVALIRLARQPSVYSRLLDAGGFVVSSFRTIPLLVHRPSLTLLSISRI